MRHRNAGRKLGRTSAHRTALLRNLVTSLLDHERIETTDAKAKELRRIADRMITLGKRGDLHARRQALVDERVLARYAEVLKRALRVCEGEGEGARRGARLVVLLRERERRVARERHAGGE